MTTAGLALRNGETASLREVPALPVQEFRDCILARVRDGARIAALFGCPAEAPSRTRLFACIAQADEGTVSISSTVVSDAYPALTPDCPQAHLFERELAEQCGVRPLGHPWLKPVRVHHPTDFFAVSGEHVHEVAVGPVAVARTWPTSLA